MANARIPVTANADFHAAAAMTNPVSTGTVRPPKLLPIMVNPITRPVDLGNQMPTRRPAGSTFIPEKAANCTTLSAYRCHSSVMRGRMTKLTPRRVMDPASNGRAP